MSSKEDLEQCLYCDHCREITMHSEARVRSTSSVSVYTCENNPAHTKKLYLRNGKKNKKRKTVALRFPSKKDKLRIIELDRSGRLT
jgi:hypothetical protein